MKENILFRHVVLYLLLVVTWGTTVFGFDEILPPSGGRILSGSGQISLEGSTLTVVQKSKTLMIEWEHFDIGTDTQVVFVQPPGSLGVLNRISGSVPSRISGDIHANGKIILVHPAGFIFTESARVIAGDVTISTREILEAEFISACVEDENDSWSQSLSDAPSCRILNAGLVQADSGTVELLTGSDGEIENTGVIRARTTKFGPGRILLIADRSSGRVVVGGTLDASAPDGGSGGFIETSAANVEIRPEAVITTWSENGGCGQWLLDPKDFVVASENGDVTGDQVTQFLQNSHLEIQSAWGATEGSGDIYINDHITWAANTLTLSAHRNIAINRELYGSGTAALILQYGQGAPDGIIDGTEAEYHVNAPVNLPKGQNFRTRMGSGGTEKIFTVITELGEPGSRTAQDLQGMNGDLRRNYALGRDIDAGPTKEWRNGDGFEPIGGPFGSQNFFYDMEGLGHGITGLNIHNAPYHNLGFFHCATGSISNLKLEAFFFTTPDNNSFTGTLAAIFQGKMFNCSASGHIISNNTASAGGLVGTNMGWIQNCFTNIRIEAKDKVGGIAGINSHVYGGAKIINCFSQGTITGENYVGGIVGVNQSVILNSYSTASIVGTFSTGGLIGYNQNASEGMNRVTNCYSSGSVAASDSVGGLIGNSDSYPLSHVYNCFWDVNTSGRTTSAGGTGKTTTEMVQLETFQLSGWDISKQGHDRTVWRMYQGQSYPLLRRYLTPITLGYAGSKAYDGTLIVPTGSIGWNPDPASPFYPEWIIGGPIRTLYQDVGIQQIDPDSLCSHQLGYDIRLSDFSGYSITPVPLTITAQDHMKSYDGIPYQGGNGVIGTGFVNNESMDVLSGTLSYGGNSQGATQPGTYTIIPTGLTSTNYTITFQPGTLTIGSPPPEFTVLLSAEPLEGGTVFGEGKYVFNDTVTVTAIPNPGYNFVHWTENGSPVSTDPSVTFTITENRSLTAVFSPMQYTVTLLADPAQGGTVSGGGSFTYGSPVTVSATPNSGYNFVHWTENGSPVSTSASYSFTITSDRTLTGHFDMIPSSKPVIDRLSPSETTAGGKAISLNVFGECFDASSQVCWNGSKRQTTIVSAGALTADITEIDILDPGTASITVVNRLSDNWEIQSDPFPFEIRPKAQTSVETIPTLGEWGAILLVFGLLLTAVGSLKSKI